MADVQLLDVRQRRDGNDILVGKTVSGVHRQAQRVTVVRRPGETSQLRRLVRVAAGVGVLTRVQLHRVRSQRRRMVEGVQVGIDEEGGADTRRLEPPQGGGDSRPHGIGSQVQSPLGGHLLALLGYQRRLHGRQFHRDVDDGRGRRQLEVDPGADGLRQEAHIAVVDVAPVLAQVDGDPVGAPQFGEHRRADWIGFVGPARLTHRGDVIDVDVEPHRRVLEPCLALLTRGAVPGSMW